MEARGWQVKSGGESEDDFPVTVTVDGYTFKIQADGTIERATGISIPSSLSVEENGTAELTASVSEDITEVVKWQVEDDSVVTISPSTGNSITVTAKGKAGSNTTITATVTSNGETFTAKCLVTIEATIEYASEDTSYVGDYAYLDEDNIPDGIIYADLAQDKEGKWKNDSGVFKYTNKKEKGLRKYTIEEERSSDKFGNYLAPGIRVTSGGGDTDRFYVMALEDIGSHYWYYEGNGLGTEKQIEDSEKEFEKDSGRENTNYWLEKYNDSTFQSTHGNQNVNDIWNIIQKEGILNKYGKSWFVPSKVEMAAFGAMCYAASGFPVESSPGTCGLSLGCWTSSLTSNGGAFTAKFGSPQLFLEQDGIKQGNVNTAVGLRLSTTF